MKYLSAAQLDFSVQQDHPIEQFLGEYEVNGFRVLRWISIEKNQQKSELVLHEVFDDSQEGITSLYDFSYVEPDDLYGKVIFLSDSLNEVLQFAKKQYGASNEKYLNAGFLDDMIGI